MIRNPDPVRGPSVKGREYLLDGILYEYVTLFKYTIRVYVKHQTTEFCSRCKRESKFMNELKIFCQFKHKILSFYCVVEDEKKRE